MDGTAIQVKKEKKLKTYVQKGVLRRIKLMYLPCLFKHEIMAYVYVYVYVHIHIYIYIHTPCHEKYLPSEKRKNQSLFIKKYVEKGQMYTTFQQDSVF